jgi:hypothetical protein
MSTRDNEFRKVVNLCGLFLTRVQNNTERFPAFTIINTFSNINNFKIKYFTCNKQRANLEARIGVQALKYTVNGAQPSYLKISRTASGFTGWLLCDAVSTAGVV